MSEAISNSHVNEAERDRAKSSAVIRLVPRIAIIVLLLVALGWWAAPGPEDMPWSPEAPEAQ